MSLSTRPSSGPVSAEAEAETIPDRVVRICSKCSRPLSVGERMFYFLEAVNTPCLCRICVLEQEREITSISNGPEESTPSTHLVPPSPTPAPVGPPATGSVRRVRLLDAGTPEEDRDSFGSRDGLPSGARQLRLAASHYVDEGRLEEAIECIRELASELALVDSAYSAPSEGIPMKGSPTLQAGKGDARARAGSTADRPLSNTPGSQSEAEGALEGPIHGTTAETDSI